MRIVAAPRDENDILEEDRARLREWAPSNGCSYVEYGDVFDLLSQLNDAGNTTLEEIEIVAHGNPVLCNGMSVDNAEVVGISLRRIAGIGPESLIYLSGCNTGLDFNGECVARAVAAAFGGTVFGAPPDARATIEEVNGLPALVTWVGDAMFSIITFAFDGEHIAGINAIVNPDKLQFAKKQKWGTGTSAGPPS